LLRVMFQAMNETERVRSIHDKGAAHYDRQISFFERVLFGDGRQWATAQASGDVLELAVGTARNLPFYSDEVRLTGVELSPEMLALAKRRAGALGRSVDLHLGDAQELEFDDSSFDTVLITLGLCTIPQPEQAAAEAFRVLRPDGRLVLLEHVRSPLAPIRAVQRVLEPLAVRFEADHLLRDPLDYLGDVGFGIESVKRLKWGIVERLVATKPASGDG
jgi:ubiquinone/menaquinone biosynthesis C-methylase UbiE